MLSRHCWLAKELPVGTMYYGTATAVEIDMGPEACFTVLSDGQGSCKMRQGPEYNSPSAGEVGLEEAVRIDKVFELPNGGKMRAHICEPVQGWVTMNLLQATP